MDVSSPEDNDLAEGLDERREEIWDDNLEPGDGDGVGVDAGRSGRGSPASPTGGLFTSDPFRTSPDSQPQLPRPAGPSNIQQSLQRHGQHTERTPLLARVSSTSASFRARKPSAVKDYPRRLSFAPDGIGTYQTRTKSPESPRAEGRRRSSGAVARRRRPHDVGESTNGQTVRLLYQNHLFPPDITIYCDHASCHRITRSKSE